MLDRAIFIAERKKLYDQKRIETRGRKRKDVDFKDQENNGEVRHYFLAALSPRKPRAKIGLAERVIKEACRIAERLSTRRPSPPFAAR